VKVDDFTGDLFNGQLIDDVDRSQRFRMKFRGEIPNHDSLND